MTELLSARSGGTFTTRTMSSSGHTYDRTLSVLSDDSDFEYLDIPETPDPFDESWYSFHKSISGPDGEELFSETEVLSRIPFRTIHQVGTPKETTDALRESISFRKRKAFIPGEEIHVKITNIDRQHAPHILNPYLYTIECTHGEFKWSIKRRYKHFHALHTELMLLKTKLKIPIPTKQHRKLRRESRRKNRHLPRFPMRPDTLITSEKLETRKQELEDYLQNILKSSIYRNHSETLKFLEVSRLSFVYNLGSKNKEGQVKKRAGGRRITLGCCNCVGKVTWAGHWSKRWLVVKDTWVGYIHEDGRVGDVLLMDQDFELKCGFLETGVHHGLLISNLARHLTVKCWTHRKAREWKQHLEDTAATTGNDFTTPNRYDSFAPERPDSFTQWFVDGASYFYSVSVALELAKEEIFITDWWLSPEIFMRRPVTEGPRWRLDNILKRKAEQGVKIFILLYKEVEMALGINSLYSKQTLVKDHTDNIKVLRSPDHVPGGVFLWAHHEKLVVIDQKVAFLGGLDLCYGRWDDEHHRLADLGSVRLSTSREPSVCETPPLPSIREQPEESVLNDSVFEPSLETSSTPLSLGSDQDEVDHDNEATKKVHFAKKPVKLFRQDAVDRQSRTDSETKHETGISEPKSFEVEVDINKLATEENDPEFQDSKKNSGDHLKPPVNDKTILTSMTDKMKTDDWALNNKFSPEILNKETGTKNADEAMCAYVISAFKNPNKTGSQEKNGVGQHEKVEIEMETREKYAGNGQIKIGGNETNNNSNQDSGNGSRETTPEENSIEINHSLVQEETCLNVDEKTISTPQEPIENSENENPDKLKISLYDGNKGEEMKQSKQEHLKAEGEPDTKEEMKHAPVGSGQSTSLDNKPADLQNKPTGLQRKAGDVDKKNISYKDAVKDGTISFIDSDEEDVEAVNEQMKLLLNVNTPEMDRKSTAKSPDQNEKNKNSDILDPNQNRDKEEDKHVDIIIPQIEVTFSKDKSKAKQADDDNQNANNTERESLIPENAPDKSPKQKRPSKLGLLIKRHLSQDDKKSRLKVQKQSTEIIITPATPTTPKSPGREFSWEHDDTPDFYYDTVTRGGMPTIEDNTLRSTHSSHSANLLNTQEDGEERRSSAFKKRARIVQNLMRRFDVQRQRSLDVDLEEEDRLIQSTGLLAPAARLGMSPSEQALSEMGLQGSTKLWIGKDYTNFIHKDFVKLDDPFTDFIDRNVTPRMPWHDVGAVVYGKPARDLARHFIQRWNFTKITKAKFNHNYPLLLPKSYERTSPPKPFRKYSTPCNVQIIRSASKWSAGTEHTDHSIHTTYIEKIKSAKHYIYIENQFFISIFNHPDVHNKISEALYERIVEAHRNNETFRVYVVMPLLPAFEGQIGTASGAAIQAITHWNYQSICRGGHSLLERLAAQVGDTTKYITFYGLRTHEVLNEQLVSELIYVHSKLMIVDDNTVIMGSANINDRSMLGKRDSELAMIAEDVNTYPSVMNGKPFEAGMYASTLRKKLFKEHLGINTNYTDPVCDSFYDLWTEQAAKNTEIYEKVFNCVPSNQTKTFAQLHEYQKIKPLAQSDPIQSKNLVKEIQGNLVCFPMEFLSKENINPGIGQKEALVPTSLWT